MDDGRGSRQQSHWERWTDDSGPFYRACAVVPFDSPTETAPESPDRDRPEVQFTTGIMRKLLRNLPTVLLVVLAVYVPAQTIYHVTTGRLQFDLTGLTTWTGVLLIPGLLIGGLWLYLSYRISVCSLSRPSFHRGIVFFVTAIPLAAGTVHAAHVAWTTGGSGADPALTVQAGYFLFILVNGHLVYDGLALRTENLFARLKESGIVRQPAYDEFYEDLVDNLGDTLELGPVSVPRSVGFSVVVAVPPILLPVIVVPQGWWGLVAYVAYSTMTLFVIAVFYDVVVLVSGFTELLRRDVLVYRPFHPDEHGGFRDLGRFSTRVNTILAVAGGYVAYRFYAEGILNLPGGGFGSSLAMLTWVVVYLGPILAYVFLVVFWVYHSFWRLHRKMEAGRRQRMEELQRRARSEREDPEPTFTDLETDAPAWESLRGAPTWPIKRPSLFGIVVVDAVPVLLTFLF